MSKYRFDSGNDDDDKSTEYDSSSSRKIDLYVPCLACSKGSARNWYHNNCGGKMLIRDDAFLQCTKCRHSSIVFGWKVICQNHGYTSMPVSKQGVANALHIMIELNVDSDFIAKLSAAIQKNQPK